MEDAAMAKAEAIRRAYAQAKEMQEEGVPGDMIEDTIKKKLIECGLKPAAAVIICSNLPGVRPNPEDGSAQARKNMIIGTGLILSGILVSWGSEFFALKKGGLYYIIALGPVFAGLGMFVKGALGCKSWF